MRLIAELSMPNVGSWNGQWSGQGKTYTKSLDVSPKKAEELIGYYYHSFGDGWGAGVEIRKPKKRERATNQFCGYEWMIASIRNYGEILDTAQKRERARKLDETV